MARRTDVWDFGDIFGGTGSRESNGRWREWAGRAGRAGRRRTQFFESGDMKFIILRLLKEKPRHGYEIIKALEEKMWGCYTPSAGVVYPTLQLLEDQGFVRAVETDGKKVYHITPDGERFLDEHRDTIDGIFERLRETVRDFAGGAMGELNGAFARLAKSAYKPAWRGGPGHPAIKRVTEILRKATEDIDAAWQADSERDSGAL
jgi:DNA-binding PadR family transcriptional regulator